MIGRMSTEAIQQVVRQLEALPESDQRLVLDFLVTIKVRRQAASANAAVPVSNPALVLTSGLLVFTGKLDGTDTDWVRREREERENELLAAVEARNTRA
jgi:hypothetical protein